MLNTWESNMSCYVWLSAERILRGNADFFISKAPGLTRGRARFKHGGMLTLLKYPFYPLFILDNSMNSISKSLTVLTRPNYCSFSHLHIYFGGTSFLQVFCLFWSMKWRDPWSSANTEKDEGQRPKEGPKPMLIRSPFIHIHLPREPKDQSMKP